MLSRARLGLAQAAAIYVRNMKYIAANVCMSDGAFLYTYEYQGNAAKLVHTPLQIDATN